MHLSQFVLRNGTEHHEKLRVLDSTVVTKYNINFYIVATSHLHGHLAIACNAIISVYYGWRLCIL